MLSAIFKTNSVSWKQQKMRNQRRKKIWVFKSKKTPESYISRKNCEETGSLSLQTRVSQHFDDNSKARAEPRGSYRKCENSAEKWKVFTLKAERLLNRTASISRKKTKRQTHSHRTSNQSLASFSKARPEPRASYIVQHRFNKNWLTLTCWLASNLNVSLPIMSFNIDFT